jgi:hypothetical protein
MKVAILERKRDDRTGTIKGVYIVESDARSAAIAALGKANPGMQYTWVKPLALDVEYDVRTRTRPLD